MYKLIRDNILKLMQEAGLVCNYAVAQNKELVVELLKEKLLEEVNEFLYTGTITAGNVEELADILTVVNAIAEVCDWNLSEAYNKKLKTHGGFTETFVGFFPDPIE